MPTSHEILQHAKSLPVEERVTLIDSLLRTLNAPDSAMDQKWVAVARKRLEEIRSGEKETVPGETVFAKVEDRFGR